MSALSKRLRRAAEEMHRDARMLSDDNFLHAVGDWLESRAAAHDAFREAGARGLDTESHEFIVATAYLGDP